MPLQGLNGSLQGLTNSLQGFGLAADLVGYIPFLIDGYGDYLYVLARETSINAVPRAHKILKYDLSGSLIDEWDASEITTTIPQCMKVYNDEIFIKRYQNFYVYNIDGTYDRTVSINPDDIDPDWLEYTVPWVGDSVIFDDTIWTVATTIKEPEPTPWLDKSDRYVGVFGFDLNADLTSFSEYNQGDGILDDWGLDKPLATDETSFFSHFEDDDTARFVRVNSDGEIAAYGDSASIEYQPMEYAAGNLYAFTTPYSFPGGSYRYSRWDTYKILNPSTLEGDAKSISKPAFRLTHHNSYLYMTTVDSIIKVTPSTGAIVSEWFI